LCLLTLGVLAVGLSVNAAPRDGATARGRDAGRSDSLRVLAGSDTQLRSAIDEGTAAGDCITFDTVPVNPYPGGGSYPAGASINGNTISLPGGAAQRVWLELRISNWACAGTMGAWQAQYDGPEGAFPAGIVKPSQACGVAADCHAAGIGPGDGADCGLDTPGECYVAFMQQTNQGQPTALNLNGEACGTPYLICGGFTFVTPPIADDGGVHYAMTLVLEVTAGFVGAADIGPQDPGDSTFFQDGNGTNIPIGVVRPATILVPLGSCCTTGPSASCTEDVPEGSCPSPASWREGIPCPENGGPTCCECVVDQDCVDSLGACTTEDCNNCSCVITPIAGYAPGGPNCCNPATGALAPRTDHRDCTVDSCNADDGASIGVPVHNPAGAGAPCDDRDPCTYSDECDGVSTSCQGTQVNGETCATTDDCTNGGETAGAFCVDNACECAGLAPADVGDDTCQTIGSDTGIPCSTSADCTPPAVCGLKNRYITIVPPVTVDPVSIMVEIVSMPQFPARVGEIWWAGSQMSIPNAPNAPLNGAPLLCEASPTHAQVWADDYVHLFGAAIVPGSEYHVRICAAGGTPCSDPLLVATAKWGDLIRPFGGSSQPNFGDISSLVSKFSELPSAPDMPRADLMRVGAAPGQSNNTPDQVANFSDIAADVLAFRGFPYHFTAASCP